MKRDTSYPTAVGLAAMIWMLVLSVTVLPGCPGTTEIEQQRFALRMSADTYATTMLTLADFRALGLIDDQSARDIEHWRAIARTALDAWRLAIDNGGPTSMYVQQFNTALNELLKEQAAAERARDNPATQPAAWRTGHAAPIPDTGSAVRRI